MLALTCYKCLLLCCLAQLLFCLELPPAHILQPAVTSKFSKACRCLLAPQYNNHRLPELRQCICARIALSATRSLRE